MEHRSVAAISVDDRVPLPACVRERAGAVFRLALLKAVGVCLMASAITQMALIWLALRAGPHLHYVVEIGT